MSVTLAFLALVVELALGYSNTLVRRVGHPVIWIGSLIDRLDRSLNSDAAKPVTRITAGVVALAIIVLIAAGAGLAIQIMAEKIPFGVIVAALLASSLIAQRSLGAHVSAVAQALEQSGVAAGQSKVANIVGRDTGSLDEAGISRAAIESLAENFSDGVVAPAFWLAVASLPGIAAYKAINTADSMIGHRTPRYRYFGAASARLDDLINLPASRIAALLVIAAAFLVPGVSARSAWQAVWRDARNHRSPNAGWPEAAFAGALGIALAGPRQYDGETVDDAFMGTGGRWEIDRKDIRHALTLYWTADLLMIAIVALLAGIIYVHG